VIEHPTHRIFIPTVLVSLIEILSMTTCDTLEVIAWKKWPGWDLNPGPPISCRDALPLSYPVQYTPAVKD
jgi:hypothetical protein